MVEITVRDEGLGIPPEQMPLLFRRFVRLPRDLASNVRGTGLGLYLCRLVAVAHDGTIELADEPGWAASFVARLPVEARKVEVQLTPLLSPAGAH